MSQPIYRVFSNIIVFNIIVAFLLVVTLQFTVVGLLEKGIDYIINWHIVELVFFVILLFTDIWLLTSTLLPIIKIDDTGIKAYSLFWTRKLAWEEVMHTRLLLVESWHSTGRQAVTFKTTSTPIKSSKRGVRSNTFIMVSRKPIKLPESLSLSATLLNHRKMTTKDDITFEFEEIAWQVIQQNIRKNK